MLCSVVAAANGSSGDQDLMPHLLKSLVSHAGEQLGKNLVELLLQGGSGLLAAPQEDSKQATELPRQELYANGNRSEKLQTKVNDFDLNDIYIDSDDGGTDLERSSPPTTTTNPATSSPDYPSWIHQTSRNSDSASDQSPSSSSEDAQVYMNESLTSSIPCALADNNLLHLLQMRTGRIVFKLFGKEPNDFPPVLRGQVHFLNLKLCFFILMC